MRIREIVFFMSLVFSANVFSGSSSIEKSVRFIERVSLSTKVKPQMKESIIASEVRKIEASVRSNSYIGSLSSILIKNEIDKTKKLNSLREFRKINRQAKDALIKIENLK